MRATPTKVFVGLSNGELLYFDIGEGMKLAKKILLHDFGINCLDISYLDED